MSQQEQAYYSDEYEPEENEETRLDDKTRGQKFGSFLKGVVLLAVFIVCILWLGDRAVVLWDDFKSSQTSDAADAHAYETAVDLAKGQYAYNAEHYIGPGKEYASNVEDLRNDGLVPWDFDGDIVELLTSQSEEGDTYRAEIQAEDGETTYVVTHDHPEPAPMQ